MKKTMIATLAASLMMCLITVPVAAGDDTLTAVQGGSVSGVDYGFYEYLPTDYGVDPSDEWPLVIFLHGLGERGNGQSELGRVLNTGLPDQVEDGMNNGDDYPYIMIAPQTSETWWNPSKVDALLEYAKNEYDVDPDRIYMTGLSMGGGGVLDYAVDYHDKLAAIVPIAAHYTASGQGDELADLPAWLFTAFGDRQINPNRTIDWTNEIAGGRLGSGPTDVMSNYPGTGTPGNWQETDKDRTASFDPSYTTANHWEWRDGIDLIAGSSTLLTLYNSTYHDSWTETYASGTVWNWLLAQDRGGNTSPPQPDPTFSDDFENGTARWSTAGGSWSVTTDGSQVYRQSTESGSARAIVMAAGASGWSDYTVRTEAKITGTNSNAEAVLIGRYVSSNQWYQLHIKASGWGVYKNQSGNWIQLASGSTTFNKNQYYDLALTFSGSSIVAEIDGVQVASVNDSSFSQGSAGVRTYLGSASFDDFIVE